MSKAIYMGMPMRLCRNETCSAATGIGANLASLIPVAAEDEHGEPVWAFTVYEGSYPVALWHWLRGAA